MCYVKLLSSAADWISSVSSSICLEKPKTFILLNSDDKAAYLCFVLFMYPLMYVHSTI
uniref:Uncharacterized protein n=1 Tax=Arion vulgaris TaxID=1028688 RepID=A0A0B7BJQ5_9EUPU